MDQGIITTFKFALQEEIGGIESKEVLAFKFYHRIGSTKCRPLAKFNMVGGNLKWC